MTLRLLFTASILVAVSQINAQNNPIYFDPQGGAGGDLFGIKVTETGNNTSKLHIYRNFSFETNDVDRLVISSAGKIGIGNSDPQELLHLNGNLLLNSFALGSQQGIFFREGFSTSNKFNLSIMNYDDGDGSPDAMLINAYDGIYFNTGSNSMNTRMHIRNNGNVGIGTVTPNAKLDIKIGSSETVNSVNLYDGNYEIGSIRKLSSTDGRGLVISGKTENATTAQPTLILAGYTKDFAADNSYDAAVSIRGYNVDNNSALQSAPIFKVLNGAQSSYFTVNSNGNVGIGTNSPDSKFTVAGNIHSQEVKVTVDAGADFVFEDDYNLRTLEETEQFITENNHLPEIASADEMVENGLEVGKMNIKLLQKVEELTLYMIEMNKEMKSQKEEINLLKSENQKLHSELTELKKGK